MMEAVLIAVTSLKHLTFLTNQLLTAVQRLFLTILSLAIQMTKTKLYFFDTYEDEL
jgi:hypothetical protein